MALSFRYNRAARQVATVKLTPPGGIEMQTAPQRPNTTSIGGAWVSWDTLSVIAPRAAPPLLFGIRLWAAVCLALFVAFWLELDTPSWAGTSAALVCQPRLGASLRKGWFRMIGTFIGAVVIVILAAWVPENRGGIL